MLLVYRTEIGSSGDEVGVDKVFAGFEFNDDLIGDKEIEPMEPDLRVAVVDWHR